MDTQGPDHAYDKILQELRVLDKEAVELDDIQMKASQCYKFSFHPPHVLFNTNCPDSLRVKVLSIFSKYLKEFGHKD